MFGYEIDFLPVGDGEKSGDAIAIRYGEENDYLIHVVDGGSLDSGEEMVKHIRQYYGNPDFIEHVVLTHADNDHSSGLRKVIEEFEIGEIWMNRPWLYADETLHLFEGSNLTVEKLEKQLREAYPILVEIEDMADKKQIPIREVFQGAQIDQFTILAPSRQRYLELIPQFDRTPEAAEEATAKATLGQILGEALKKAAAWIAETWGKETLEEDVETSASNESSVVQIADFDGNKVLLLGDAGIISLNEAADYAELIGITLPGLSFMQVPHHGSRHNVSPSVLNRWLGEQIPKGSETRFSAFASVAKKDEERPRRKVVNAFIRRGSRVYATKGSTKHHFNNMPDRGWSKAVPYEFFDQVEG